MKRRDITLGEMQDECALNDRVCCKTETKPECKYLHVCKCMTPKNWDLSDPPRFTDAQMAFLRGCYAIGIVGMMRSGDGAKTHFFTEFETIGFMKNKDIPLEVGETLDLAELLGKDGAE